MSREVAPAEIERTASAWLVAEGLTGSDIANLLTGFAERLADGGLRLSRAYLAMATISPEVRAVNVTWRRGAGVERDDVGHDRFPGEFQASPIAFLLDRSIPRHRWRIGRGEGVESFTTLDRLRREGDTDYVAEIVPFGAHVAFAVQGVAFTACTDAPDGFTDAEVALLGALAQPLALATYRISLFNLAADLLCAYVGRDPGQRVLNGEVRRGHGQRVSGALMIADLSGFTSAAETGGEALIARLGEHLAAMVEPVQEAGGGVLKFLGDGIMAGFPIEDSIDPERACGAALDAACRALAMNEAVNARHPGSPPLGLKIGLHRGEVFYGNIGAGSRLDFTVIGPAVNEASRLESLCGELGLPLLMSEPFARCCGRPTASLGRHRLRGVAEPREIFALAAE